MIKFIKWLFWDFTGLRFIFRKFLPQKYDDTKGRPPSTILFWLIGIYLVAYAVAYQRHENRVDLIESRANAIFQLLSSPDMRKFAISRISALQNTPCPSRPAILEPRSIFRSLFQDQTYPEMVELLKGAVENLKDQLDLVDLNHAYLREADLGGANLKKAILKGADLRRAQLMEANLWEASLDEAILNDANLVRALMRKATLRKAKLQSANLRATKLQEARLEDADLQKADLSGAFFNEAILTGANLKETNLMDAYFPEADLKGADLSNAVFTRAYLKRANLVQTNLKNTIDLSVEELCEAKSLYKAKMDVELEDQVKEQCPQLLRKPDWLEN